MAKQVIVYSTSHCPWCRLAKEFLKANEVPFKDVDVEEDEKAAMEMFRKTGQFAVPVIDIDGTVIVGFNKKRISEALGLDQE